LWTIFFAAGLASGSGAGAMFVAIVLAGCAMGAGLFEAMGCGFSLEHPTASEQTINTAAKTRGPALLRMARPQDTDWRDSEL
jgi:hypothetical protein